MTDARRRKTDMVRNAESEPTNFTYRHPDSTIKLPLDVQRKVLRMLRRGFCVDSVAKDTGVHRLTVKNLSDRGIVFCDADSKWSRCPGCGAKLLAVPCMTCEVRSAKGDRMNERKQPKPTHRAPGTIEKVLVLAARVEAQEELHHPDDEWRVATIEQSLELKSHGQRVFRVQARGYKFLKEHIERYSEE